MNSFYQNFLMTATYLTNWWLSLAQLSCNLFSNFFTRIAKVNPVQFNLFLSSKHFICRCTPVLVKNTKPPFRKINQFILMKLKIFQFPEFFINTLSNDFPPSDLLPECLRLSQCGSPVCRRQSDRQH